MTFQRTKSSTLTDQEWEELISLKEAINYDPASVHYERMEKFADLMVRSLQERGG
jgi:hypothetical protein